MKIESARISTLLVCICALVLFTSCVQKMGKTGHLRPLGGEAPVLGLTRLPPEGTVPQSGGPERALRSPTVTRALLERGREQYSVSCLPCHGPSGHGDGMIVQRGFLAPPSYHEDRLREATDQHFFDVITQGYGAMYSYVDRVTEPDRWAVIAYIRALQLSQNAHASDLSADDQRHLAQASETPTAAGEPQTAGSKK